MARKGGWRWKRLGGHRKHRAVASSLPSSPPIPPRVLVTPPAPRRARVALSRDVESGFSVLTAHLVADRILTNLPTPSLLRLRLVSKGFLECVHLVRAVDLQHLRQRLDAHRLGRLLGAFNSASAVRLDSCLVTGAMAALRQSGPKARVVGRLALPNNRLDAADVEELRAWLAWAPCLQLETLDLSRNPLCSRGPARPDDARPLASVLGLFSPSVRSPSPPPPSSPGPVRLGAEGSLAFVRDLNLSYVALGIAGAKALAGAIDSSPGLRSGTVGLRRLLLRSTFIGERGVAALGVPLSACSALEELDVGACFLYTTGAAVLSTFLLGARRRETFRRLDLSTNGVEEAGARRLRQPAGAPIA